MALASPVLCPVSRLWVYLLQKDRRRPTRRHHVCPWKRPNGGTHTLTYSEIFPSALNSSVTWVHAKYILESVVFWWTSKKAYLSFLWSASEGRGSRAYRIFCWSHCCAKRISSLSPSLAQHWGRNPMVEFLLEALHCSTCMECLPKAGERGNEVSINWTAWS